jgi:uncharacterized damage-inducible protein DinB
MTDNFLVKLFEHNNWANEKIIQACYALNNEVLDSVPHSVTKGNIRETLTHLVTSQRGYIALLTLPVDERPTTPLSFAELEESARLTGDGLVALAKGEGVSLDSRLTTRDGFYTEPWVVLLQVINHATEHR